MKRALPQSHDEREAKRPRVEEITETSISIREQVDTLEEISVYLGKAVRAWHASTKSQLHLPTRRIEYSGLPSLYSSVRTEDTPGPRHAPYFVSMVRGPLRAVFWHEPTDEINAIMAQWKEYYPDLGFQTPIELMLLGLLFDDRAPYIAQKAMCDLAKAMDAPPDIDAYLLWALSDRQLLKEAEAGASDVEMTRNGIVNFIGFKLFQHQYEFTYDREAMAFAWGGVAHRAATFALLWFGLTMPGTSAPTLQEGTDLERCLRDHPPKQQ